MSTEFGACSQQGRLNIERQFYLCRGYGRDTAPERRHVVAVADGSLVLDVNLVVGRAPRCVLGGPVQVR